MHVYMSESADVRTAVEKGKDSQKRESIVLQTKKGIVLMPMANSRSRRRFDVWQPGDESPRGVTGLGWYMLQDGYMASGLAN